MSKEKFKPVIIVDTREKKPWKFNKCSTCEGSIIQKLDTGDYTIQGMEDIFVIEKKSSVSELYLNLGFEKDRFIREMERIQSFKYKFLFFEFGIKDIYDWATISKRITGKRAGLTPQYIISMLIELEVKYGVKTVFLGSHKSDKDKTKIKQFINRFLYKYYNLYMAGDLP